jgi:predicted  nucleic acid-binding Zn-ribbon protein
MRMALILLVLLALPLPSPAEETPPQAASPVNPAEITADEIEGWRQTLAQARERVEEAQEEVAAVQQAYRDARKRKRRGTERAELLAAREAAERELAEAEEEFPGLLEQARRAGVPPGVLGEFED